MRYKIILKKPFQKSFRKIDKQNQEMILKKMRSLYDNPRTGKPLSGELAGLWSLRINKYRVIYEIRDEELRVYALEIGHRKNVYG